MSTTIRVSEEYIPWIERAVDTVKDNYGRKRFRTKKAFIDAAVEHYLAANKIGPREESF